MICRSFPVCSTQMERKKAGMKCVIFAGLPAAPELHSWWADADYVIAADAGYENACRVGVEPDLLLGDYVMTQGVKHYCGCRRFGVLLFPKDA